MALWQWKESFTDERLCAVIADTEKEARKKIEIGDWEYEHTYDFYSNGIIGELKLAKEED